MTSVPPADGPSPEAAAKVLAHPLRSRLLAQLRRSGDATATTLASLLATNSGATSYHLRRLASVGLVVDAGTGRGKERVWRATSETRSWRTVGGDDDDAAASLDWIERDYVRHFAGKAEQWLDVAASWPPGWADHLGLDDHVTLVTQEQLVAMRAEVEEVLGRYRRVGQGNPRAKRVAVYTYAYPVDLDNLPLGGG